MDIKNSATILWFTWNQAHGIMKRSVDWCIERNLSIHESMGIDEKSYGKYLRYITVIYDIDRSGVDHVEFDRKQKSLDLYYKSICDKALDMR
ncbi:hypothetical protein OXIME_001406 [Oxyplasma meridianum]|uniref:Uncharacterized protein n=1 Tax=Oxyplasma meridianum TaxID=3073602 RepID=A0AAX4NFZ3_9ARCH